MSSINLSKKSHEPNVNILLYHQIGDFPNAYTNLNCFCRTEEFYRQMEFLSTSGHKVISMAMAVDLLFNKRLTEGKFIVLTFDDGCEKFYNKAFPILEKFGFPSIIYPVASYLGKYATWGSLINPDLKILSERMLIELHGLGVEIGGHTMDHPKLTSIDNHKAIDQIRISKETFEQLLGENIQSFAYPHGDYNKRVIDIVKEAGFTNAVTCIPSVAGEAKSIYEIPRKYITFFDDISLFKQKLESNA